MAAKQEQIEPPEVPAPFKPLISGIKDFYHTQEFSDLTIKCETDSSEWKVHKVVVCAQSEVLKTTILCGAPLEQVRVSHIGGMYFFDLATQKSEKNVITLDDDPQVIEAMLNYLYTSQYGDFGNRQEHASPLVLDARMFIVADKYDIKNLGQLASQKFTARCGNEWATVAFAEAVKEVYDNGPSHDDNLKRVILETVWEHHWLLADAKKDEYAPFHRVLREIGDFGADVAQRLANDPSQFRN